MCVRASCTLFAVMFKKISLEVGAGAFGMLAADMAACLPAHAAAAAPAAAAAAAAAAVAAST